MIFTTPGGRRRPMTISDGVHPSLAIATAAVLSILLATLTPSIAIGAPLDTVGVNGPIVYHGNAVDIYSTNADGADRRQLTTDPERDARPTFSPDGSRIVFTSHRDSGGRIYIMNADGSGQAPLTTLTGNAFQDDEATFSPDGSMVAFTRRDRITGYRIYLINTDGTGLRRLTDSADQADDDDEPEFSPDGTRVVFSSNRSNRNALYSINVDGSDLKKLTDDTLPTYGNASYSPDGNSIAFDNFRDIFIMNADGTNVRPLTNNQGFNIDPSYSPDGEMIAFHSDRAGRAGIFVMKKDGSQSRQIAVGFEPDWGVPSGQVAPSPGSPLSLTASPTSQVVGGGNSVTLRLSGAAPRGTSVGFAVISGPDSGFARSSSSDASGTASVFLEGAAPGVDTVRAWLDRNSNGLFEAGETSVTTSATWTAPATSSVCGDARFIALAGSGEKFRARDDLTISPTVYSSYLAFKATLGRNKNISIRVVDYPAESVLVIPNFPRYIGGKNQGVDRLLDELRVAKEQNCRRIVLSGYSQGAIAIHQAVNRPEIANDEYYRGAIRAIILIADGSRVRQSGAILFGTARSDSSGLCLSIPFACQGTEQITDIAPAFRSSTINVCNVNDVVCDYSTVLDRYRRILFVGFLVGKAVHTTYPYSDPVTRAGQLAARNVNRR